MADTSWPLIVGAKTIADGGYIGDLMTVANAHIQEAIDTGRITQAEAGQVYTAMIPAAFREGASYFLQKKQIDLGIIPSALSK